MSDQPRFESHGSVQLTNQSLPVIITLVLLIFLFLAFLCIYFCRCIMEYMNSTQGLVRRNSNGNTTRRSCATQGLDPTILLSFPTFEYSKVKDLREEKYGLECAVCLSEFHDDDVLRLITVCNHAFHPECIDLWLSSHTTCPVCRRDLNNPWETSPEKSPDASVVVPVDVDVDVDRVIEEGRNDMDVRRVSFMVDEGVSKCRNEVGPSAPTEENLGSHENSQRFSRSHSTGHSIVRAHDRYTLILPDKVKERLMRGHHYTGSCTVFGEYSGNVTVEKSGLAEISET